MSYANLSIAPVRLAQVVPTKDYGKPTLTLVFLAKGVFESSTALPIVCKIYGQTCGAQQEYFTKLLETDKSTNYLLMGEALLCKPESPYLQGIDDIPLTSCASIPFIKMPSIMVISKAENNELNSIKLNRCIVGGSSNKPPEIIHAKSGKVLCKHSFGVYSHKENGKGVYSYFNCTIFNDNYGDLVRENTGVVIEGRLSVSFSDKTKLHYFDVVANNFKKIGRDDNGGNTTSRGYPVDTTASVSDELGPDGKPLPF